MDYFIFMQQLLVVLLMFGYTKACIKFLNKQIPSEVTEKMLADTLYRSRNNPEQIAVRNLCHVIVQVRSKLNIREPFWDVAGFLFFFAVCMIYITGSEMILSVIESFDKIDKAAVVSAYLFSMLFYFWFVWVCVKSTASIFEIGKLLERDPDDKGVLKVRDKEDISQYPFFVRNLLGIFLTGLACTWFLDLYSRYGV